MDREDKEMILMDINEQFNKMKRVEEREWYPVKEGKAMTMTCKIK